jgi:hypothetical protein
MPEPEPQTTTVNLYRKRLATVAQIPVGADMRIYAEISWGAGKSAETALVDFHHGTRITLDASSVVVGYQVRNQSGNPALVFANEIAVSLVYGHVTGKQATFTPDHFAAGAAPPGTFRPIPEYARTLLVLSDNPANTTAVVSFSSDAKGTGVQSSVGVPIDQEVSIPNGMEGYAIAFTIAAEAFPIFGLFL